MKIEVLPRETISQMNQFLSETSFEAVGASLTETGTLNIAFTKNEGEGNKKVTSKEFLRFCKEEMELDVTRLKVNGHYKLE